MPLVDIQVLSYQILSTTRDNTLKGTEQESVLEMTDLAANLEHVEKLDILCVGETIR